MNKELEIDHITKFLKFLDTAYCNIEANDSSALWWRYSSDRLHSLGIPEKQRVWYHILRDKKLIEFCPIPNGLDEGRMRITKYGHENIHNLLPILNIPNNSNVELN